MVRKILGSMAIAAFALLAAAQLGAHADGRTTRGGGETDNVVMNKTVCDTYQDITSCVGLVDANKTCVLCTWGTRAVASASAKKTRLIA